ncbi:MAG: hypothetical protein JSV86_10595 [Gemmatimonadota bacterium]|nr:MAG: hypothetical protein JSV86_10595 [Gemmatimonadota bacterium]
MLFRGEDAMFWKRRAATAAREVQAIKKRLRKYHGGVFKEYRGIGARKANALRRALDLHRCDYARAEAAASALRRRDRAALQRIARNWDDCGGE